MRGRIVDAALRTLTSAGYANTSVRAIATTGAFSPALVFYHFGSVDALLLAVLDRISDER
jgi:AcrR family transcriptional regulator